MLDNMLIAARAGSIFGVTVAFPVGFAAGFSMSALTHGRSGNDHLNWGIKVGAMGLAMSMAISAAAGALFNLTRNVAPIAVSNFGNIALVAGVVALVATARLLA